MVKTKVPYRAVEHSAQVINSNCGGDMEKCFAAAVAVLVVFEKLAEKSPGQTEAVLAQARAVLGGKGHPPLPVIRRERGERVDI